MFKKIIFEEAQLQAKYMLEPPKPAINYVPKWYRDQKIYSNGESDILKAFKNKNSGMGTYKACTPLVDSLTSGYMVVSSADILVRNAIEDEQGYIPRIDWTVSWAPLDIQQQEVLGNYPIPYGYSKDSFRWSHDWKVETPPGYSLMISHPAHRHDLPFFTLSGIVDTDKHPSRLLFPFFVREGFEGLIPEGTPIAQIIPFKRDNWKSERKDYNPDTPFIFGNINTMKILRNYKTKYWSKKKYE
jgi:hypothetical protein